MSYLIEWVTNIILFILLATIIDMLLPNSNLQKYSKLVIGLLLIAIILTPIFNFVSKDFNTAITSIPSLGLPNEENMKNSIDMKKKEIQDQQHAYILEQMAVQLKKGVAEELMKKYGLEIEKIDLTTKENSNQTNPENLQKVSVLLKQPGNTVETVEVMKPIVITENKPLSSKTIDDKREEVAAFLSNQWNVDEKMIEVSIDGGNPKTNG